MPDLMTLDEAIVIISLKINQGVFTVDPNAFTALKLVNEAAKRIYRQRRNEIPINQPPLPGERMV